MPSALVGDTFEDRWNALYPELPTTYRPPERYLQGNVRLASQDVPVLAYGDDIPDAQRGPSQYVPDMSISELGETGIAGPHGQSNISPDTGGSSSYGVLGLNSYSGSAAHFARSYPQLGLTAPPGTAAFDYQWRKATSEHPDELYAAQRDWHAKNIVVPVHDGLLASGVHPDIANDPRVLNYMADRRVQMGGVGWDAAMGLARGAKSSEDFIRSVSEYDRTNVGSHFQSYLADHPNDVPGLHNRIALRERLSLNPVEQPSDVPTAVAAAPVASPGPALSARSPDGRAGPTDAMGALSAILALTNQGQQRPTTAPQTGLAGLYPQPPQQSALAGDPMSALKAIAPILRFAQNA